MIPIISIVNSVSFLFSIIITRKIRLAGLQQKEDDFLKYFFYFFLFLTVYFSILTFPDILFLLGFRNVLILSVVQLSAQIMLYLALAFFVIIPLKLLKNPVLEKIILTIVLISLLTTIVPMFFWFEPSQLMIQGNFFHITPFKGYPWLRMKDGLVIGLTTLFSTVFFLVKGIQSQTKFVKKKALLLGFGILGLALAAFINYVGGAVPKFSVLTLAGVLAICGMILIYKGAVLVKKESPEVA